MSLFLEERWSLTSDSSQMGFTVPWVSLFLEKRLSMISGSSQTGFTVPWVSLFLEERWSLTSDLRVALRWVLLYHVVSLFLEREVVSDIR